jgi:hypothetical protein
MIPDNLLAESECLHGLINVSVKHGLAHPDPKYSLKLQQRIHRYPVNHSHPEHDGVAIPGVISWSKYSL